MLLQCCTQGISKFGKLSSGHRMEKVSFHFSPKEGQCQRRFKLLYQNLKKKNFNYCTIALISHASKILLIILKARLQQYVNWKLPSTQAGFRKGRGIKNQIANIHWIRKKAREFQKNIYFCFIDYTKAFDCVDHNKLKDSKRDGNTRP